jgi:peptidoglycan-associated lipoprotein
MKRNMVLMTIFIFVVGLALVFTGCAKKVAVKEEAPMEKQAAVEKQAAPEAKPPEAAKEMAPKEQMAEQKPAEAAGASAAEIAAKEASEFLDIHFAFDRSDLRPDEREILRMHAAWLKAHPDYVVRIEGNCDERGSVEYNLALGERRALSAMKYLVNLGIDKSRITTISYGKERPLDPRHNEEAWAKNRRDHFVVTLKQ